MLFRMATNKIDPFDDGSFSNGASYNFSETIEVRFVV
jgi:hypothetical protein